MTEIKVFIVDDHNIVREGLKTLMDRTSQIKIVGEAADGVNAVKLIKEAKPQVVIMDIGLPGLNGIEVTRKVLENNKQIKVIMLSMHTDKRFLMESFKAGAKGFILKECLFEELIQAIQTVAQGRTYLGPRIVDGVMRDYISHAENNASVFSLLSPKEREVLQMLAEGCNTKSIAAQLNISVKTVESRRMQLMEKLNLHSVAELTKYAIREGLTQV
jgi:DNA-binding NarL/FixJ family response regulator